MGAGATRKGNFQHRFWAVGSKSSYRPDPMFSTALRMLEQGTGNSESVSCKLNVFMLKLQSFKVDMIFFHSGVGLCICRFYYVVSSSAEL